MTGRKQLCLSYTNQTILLIIIAALIKAALGGLVELNNDEAYYWTYAQRLQWNYFDHPPMVAVVIRIFTLDLHFHHEFFLRLAGVLSAAACTWIVFKLGEALQDPFTGFIAACLYTASFYASVIAGLLILPDTPQLFFWLLSVYILVNVIKRESEGVSVNNKLLLAGFTIGLCILSKIHGIFLWAGFLGYVLFDRRSLLKNPYLYFAMLITLIMLIPSFMWTSGNNFSTYNFHSTRMHFLHFQPDSFGRELIGEILYSNPINFALLIMALLHYKKNNNPAVLLKWLAFPLILTVLFLSVFNDTLPHWNGPAYATLIPFTALYLRNITTAQGALPRSVRYALGLIVAALLVCIGMINYFPGSLGKKQLPELGKDDVTLDMSGWRQFSDSLQSHVPVSGSPACIFTSYWFPGGHLTYYAGDRLRIPVRVVGSLNDLHHFAWLNTYLPTLEKGSNAWYITISNLYREPSTALTSHFQQSAPAFTIPQYRSGKIVRYFYIYSLSNYLGGLPAHGILQ